MKPGSETVAVMNYIVTPMATSIVFKKLDEEKEAIDLEKSLKAEPDDESALAASLRARGRGGGRASAGRGRSGGGTTRRTGKGKSKSNSKGEQAQTATSNEQEEEMESESATWTAMAYPLLPVGEAVGASVDGRPKTAFDDFLHLFIRISEFYKKRISEADAKATQMYEQSSMTLFGHAVACFLEFAWTGSVAINGKFVRSYTAFRSEMTTFVKTASDLSSGSAGATGTSARLSLATKLANHISDAFDGGAGLSVGHAVKDESDESKAIARIQFALPTVKADGMMDFVKGVMSLPLEFHAKFTEASLLNQRPQPNNYGGEF